jgi:hypothetical protein
VYTQAKRAALLSSGRTREENLTADFIRLIAYEFIVLLVSTLFSDWFISRKLIVPQKEPSPLLNKKIEELEMKLADMNEGDEDLDDLEDEDEAPETPSMPIMQTPLASDLDIMPYTPPQVLHPRTHTLCPNAVPFCPHTTHLNRFTLPPPCIHPPLSQQVSYLQSNTHPTPHNPSIQPLMHHTALPMILHPLPSFPLDLKALHTHLQNQCVHHYLGPLNLSLYGIEFE